MDRIEQYRQIIKKVITEYHNLNLKSPRATLESAVVFDESNDRYSDSRCYEVQHY